MDSPPAARTLKRQLDDIINDNPTAAPALRLFWSHVNPIVDELEFSYDLLLAASAVPPPPPQLSSHPIVLVPPFVPSPPQVLAPPMSPPPWPASSEPLPWSSSPPREVLMISPVTPTPLPIVGNGYGEELARLGGGRDLSLGEHKAMYVISNLPPAFYQSAIDRFHEKSDNKGRGCWLRNNPNKDSTKGATDIPHTPYATIFFFFGDANSYAELVVLPAAALLRDWQCVKEIRRK
jgi:hypothetical protein